MDRVYKIYYKEAKRRAKETLKNKGNIFKFYLRGLLSLIGKITIIVSPISGLADVRAAKYARDNSDIVVMKSFASGDETKTYWSIMLAGLYKGLIWFTGLLAIALFGVVVFVSSAGLGNLLNSSQQMVLIIVCMIPVGLILLAYLFIFPLYTKPINYVIDTLGGKATDAIGKSYNAMSRNGKKTMFLNDLFATLKLIAVGIVIFVALTILTTLSSLIIGRSAFAYAFLPVIIFFAAKFVAQICLSRNIAEILVLEDIVLDRYTMNKSIKGINVAKVKTIKKSVGNIQDNLVRLFDETKEVKSSDEYDNDQFDEVFDKEAKEVVSTIHRINGQIIEETPEEEPLEETPVEQIEPTPEENQLEETPVEQIEPTPEENNLEEVVEIHNEQVELNNKLEEVAEEEISESPTEEEILEATVEEEKAGE